MSQDLFSLGELYLSDFLAPDEEPRCPPVEMKLIMEENGAVRLEKVADPDFMYGRYWYRSGINQTMKDELRGIVESVHKVKTLKPGDVWLDIACNDGTLLSYVNPDITRIGIDPVDDTFKREAEQHADAIVQDYFSEEAYRTTKFSAKNADVITCIAMFYDLDDPQPFLQDIRRVLKDDGLFVLQMSYTPLMLEQLAFDNVCLAEGELVTTVNGLKPIESIDVGDLVLTHRGRFRPVLRKFKTPAEDKDMIKLRAYSAGYDLTVTKNHPIYVKRDGLWTFVPAGEIELRDIVGKPVVTEAPPHSSKLGMNINLAKIAGYYMAEGSYNKHKDGGAAVTFYFNENEEDTYVAELVQALKDEGFSATRYGNTASHTTSVSTYGDMAKWLNEEFGHHAKHKTVPMWLLNYSDEIIDAFLRSYMNGDGYEYRIRSLRASSIGNDLSYGMSLLANKLGYTCSLTKQRVQQGRIINGRPIKYTHPLWDILVNTEPLVREGKSWMEDGIQCMRIRKIEEVEYTGDFVYNLEVEEDNTYVTPAMTVHNCHEHVFYYTLTTIQDALAKAGFKILDCQLNDVNGGSFRIYIMKSAADISSFGSQPYRDVCRFRTDAILTHEWAEKYNGPMVWNHFYHRLQTLKKETVAFIKQAKAEGKTVWGYGASTKGNTLLQLFGLDHTLIDGIAERSPYKFGLRTIGTNIPIFSEEDMRAAKPDYLLVLPWHFKTEFLKREHDFMQATGAQMIFPCPKFLVVGA